jgi:hypothetical protein
MIVQNALFFETMTQKSFHLSFNISIVKIVDLWEYSDLSVT